MIEYTYAALRVYLLSAKGMGYIFPKQQQKTKNTNTITNSLLALPEIWHFFRKSSKPVCIISPNYMLTMHITFDNIMPWKGLGSLRELWAANSCIYKMCDNVGGLKLREILLITWKP